MKPLEVANTSIYEPDFLKYKKIDHKNRFYIFQKQLDFKFSYPKAVNLILFDTQSNRLPSK